jgi:hypothetical protein
MQIQTWSTKPSSYSNPWAPNSTLYPFLELEVGSVPPSLNFPQLDFEEPSSGFHPVTWERINKFRSNIKSLELLIFIQVVGL